MAATVIRLRSRFERPGRSHTWANSGSSTRSAKWGVKARARSRARTVSDMTVSRIDVPSYATLSPDTNKVQTTCRQPAFRVAIVERSDRGRVDQHKTLFPGDIGEAVVERHQFEERRPAFGCDESGAELEGVRGPERVNAETHSIREPHQTSIFGSRAASAKS